jgi:hypothetical protein
MKFEYFNRWKWKLIFVFLLFSSFRLFISRFLMIFKGCFHESQESLVFLCTVKSVELKLSQFHERNSFSHQWFGCVTCEENLRRRPWHAAIEKSITRRKTGSWACMSCNIPEHTSEHCSRLLWVHLPNLAGLKIVLIFF